MKTRTMSFNIPEFSFSNWKTTGIGLLEAAMMGVFDYLLNGAFTWQGCVLAALMAIKGYVSADKTAVEDVTIAVDKATVKVAKAVEVVKENTADIKDIATDVDKIK